MGIAKLYSRAVNGLEALEVVVEVHVANGLPAFSIVGLLDTEVKESRDRVRSAIQMSGFDFPARRITVNLAPAELPKESGRYDLPIALGVLLAAGMIKPVLQVSDYEFAGELALDGTLRKIHGALAIAYGAAKSARAFILPQKSAHEASLVNSVRAYSATSLLQVANHLNGKMPLTLVKHKEYQGVTLSNSQSNNQSGSQSNKHSNSQHADNVDKINSAAHSRDNHVYDFNQVKGQVMAKRALEIAASGRHSVLMVGNPGCGKSMLAERFPSILPQLPLELAIQSASLYSLSYGAIDFSKWQEAPFRSPHHTSSSIAILGGGAYPKPGEISLAHNGTLFLDELPEFERKVLEVLREPLESKRVSISRARYKIEYPADFQLLAAMNPCPCGNYGDVRKVCKCSSEQINRYTSKISGPILDRIDLFIRVPQLTTAELDGLPTGESSLIIKNRVIKVRQLQLKRQNKLNYALTNAEITQYCQLESKAHQLLTEVVDKFGLSARAYYRLLRIARTIADMALIKTMSNTNVTNTHSEYDATMEYGKDVISNFDHGCAGTYEDLHKGLSSIITASDIATAVQYKTLFH